MPPHLRRFVLGTAILSVLLSGCSSRDHREPPAGNGGPVVTGVTARIVGFFEGDPDEPNYRSVKSAFPGTPPEAFRLPIGTPVPIAVPVYIQVQHTYLVHVLYKPQFSNGTPSSIKIHSDGAVELVPHADVRTFVPGWIYVTGGMPVAHGGGVIAAGSNTLDLLLHVPAAGEVTVLRPGLRPGSASAVLRVRFELHEVELSIATKVSKANPANSAPFEQADEDLVEVVDEFRDETPNL